MRCPKCNYISFDQVETCGKCGKDISDDAAKLTGMILAVEVPRFLRFEGDSASEDDDAEKTVVLGERTAIPDEGAALEVENGSIDFNLDSDLEMDMDDFELESPGEEGFSGDGLDTVADSEFQLDGGLELEGVDEAGLGDSGFLDLEEDLEPAGASSGASEPPGPELDFGDIDLSDLAPPVDEEEKSDEPAKQEVSFPESEPADFELDFGALDGGESGPGATESPSGSPAGNSDVELDFGFSDEAELDVAPASEPAADFDIGGADLVEEESVVVNPPSSGSGLEDLQIAEDEMTSSSLDVGKAAQVAAETGDLKTGTALDKFDLDLGDLFLDKKD